MGEDGGLAECGTLSNAQSGPRWTAVRT
jgi:hypothetical protein